MLTDRSEDGVEIMVTIFFFKSHEQLLPILYFLFLLYFSAPELLVGDYLSFLQAAIKSIID